MNDDIKTKAQLLSENKKQRERIVELEKNTSAYKNSETSYKKHLYNLQERVKELNCLYGISKLVENAEITNEDLIQSIVNLIPASWQYPEATCARVIINYREYRTKKFTETRWSHACDIFVHGKRCGSIEVFYRKEMPESDEGPFLKEERNLLNAIAERLGRILERMDTDEQIMRIQNELLQKAANLEETNTAMEVLLKHQDNEIMKMESLIVAKLKALVFPYLEKLYLGTTDKMNKTYIMIIDKNLKEITKPLTNHFSDLYTKLTPTEMQVAQLVADNKTTSEIASILNISDTTVSFHRKNIRIKLGIFKKKANLRSYLKQHLTA